MKTTIDPLPSWNESPTKSAILDFVLRVTREGPDFVSPAERIAVTDNDGTLWPEKGLLHIVALTHAGLTTDEFEQRVKRWIAEDRHPRFKGRYSECIFQPMPWTRCS